MDNKYLKLRIWCIGFFFLVSFVVISIKAVHLQVYRSPWLTKKASIQYEKSFTDSGKRGIIYDRNLQEMAVSIEVTSIAAYPSKISDAKATAKILTQALNLNLRKTQDKLNSKKSFVWIKRQTTAKETKAIQERQLQGIDFVSEFSRFYPNKTLAAQALGFTGLDGKGLEGIEFYYDPQLKGELTNIKMFKDALGNGFSAEPKRLYHNSGHNLVLTIDSNIQFITESALKAAAEQHSARSAVAIVMQPRTGAILAIAHYPLFNPNSYLDFDKSLWRNRAITDPFEPGSTMKIFSAAAALESGSITPHTIFFCENGAYRIGKNVVHDIRKHGWLSLQQIIKFSSNIGAVKVSEKVGAKKLYHTFRNFGFGQKTGIDCPGETTGSLFHFKNWSNIDTAAISFGHGLSVSAIQLISGVSAIANDGILMQPYLLQEISNQHGQTVSRFTPRQVRRAVSVRTARILNNILRTVITEGGTGINASLAGYSAGGKTGTARKLDEKGEYSRRKHIASFVGFTPTHNPEIAILVVIDEPQGKYHGGIVAAPVFKSIANETLNYLNIPPENGPSKFRVSLDLKAKG